MTATKNETGLWEMEVDAQKYEFQKWGAEESLTMLLRMAKVLGAPLGNLVTSVIGAADSPDQVKMDMDIPNLPAVVGSALVGGLGGLDTKEVVAICKAFSSGDRVLCDGQKVAFNTHYEDKLDHMFRVVYAGIEVQYGSFFGGLKALVGVLKRRPGTGTPAQSTGLSGDRS